MFDLFNNRLSIVRMDWGSVWEENCSLWILDRIDNLYVVGIAYHLVTICEVFCTDIRLLIVLRVLTGLFDALTAVSQAYWSAFLTHA